MIIVRGLTKRFGAQEAVVDLSFEIPAGQVVGLIGPNGAGKTTTLKMLVGMIEPTSGSASVCGHDLREAAMEAKRRIGFVPESGGLFESLTGQEYLELIAALYGLRLGETRGRIAELGSFFDLDEDTLGEKLLGAYSKGMRRKVLVAAALLHNPAVVIFDEPLDGLDPGAAAGLKALIQSLARQGKTILYSSHVLDVVERVCDRVLILDHGRLLLDGRPEELMRTSRSSSLERLFVQLIGAAEKEGQAEAFAKTFRS